MTSYTYHPIDRSLTPGCSWLPYRLNVVPFGGRANHIEPRFVDSIPDAVQVRAQMIQDGADDVGIYDTVEGVFYV